MKRAFLFAALASSVLFAVAGPAWAKGEGDSISGSAVITGPGLGRPIGTAGRVEGFPAPRTSTAFGTLLDDSGLSVLTSDSPLDWVTGNGGGAYTAAPDRRSLGPRYTVTFILDIRGTRSRVEEDLYPYATDGPVLFTPLGQSIDGTDVLSGWFRASGRLLPALLELGLPASAPRVPSGLTSPNPVPGQVSLPAGASHWIWLAAAAGLMAMLGAGVAAERRRRAPAAL
jgi:hypothetical protein